MEYTRNKTEPHHLRHEKKIRKLTELRNRQKLNHSLRVPELQNSERLDKESGNTASHNFTVKLINLPGNNTSNETVKEIFKERMGAHKNCYTTNDVLEIIAITCLVNFIFWFLIISCVNMLTRNQKILKSDR